MEKKVEVETETVNKLSKNVTTDNITELNNLADAGKIVSGKIIISLRNTNRIKKAGWEKRRKGWKKLQKTSESTKEGKIHNDTMKRPKKDNNRQEWQYNWKKYAPKYWKQKSDSKDNGTK